MTGSGFCPQEMQLASLAVSLGAESVAGLSAAERQIVAGCRPVSSQETSRARDQIRAGNDPLGEAFCQVRGPAQRRSNGCILTPPSIVSAMVGAALDRPRPSRVIDPGIGTGRFLLEAGRRAAGVSLLGIEVDPLVALFARANLAAAGLGKRSRVLLADYRSVSLGKAEASVFIGNPPYVRHHDISAQWKAWFSEKCRSLEVPCSGLAGLHVYFYVATALRAVPGDTGAFITSSEWLDVNYGKVIRSLLLDNLGLQKLTIIEPAAEPFPGTATTAAIAYFQVGSQAKTVAVARVKAINPRSLNRKGRRLPRGRLRSEERWSGLSRPRRSVPKGFVELGELCRVHRGQVTGADRVWIAGEHSVGLPRTVLYPSVTRARELIESRGRLADATALRNVIDIPAELDTLSARDNKAVQAFLQVARKLGAGETYIARNRKKWWSVGLRQAAPILATYMARRPPAFVRNIARARHLNIAHGIYPRVELDDTLLDKLADYLSNNVSQNDGRTYAGGLTKFEPKEVERLLVPDLPLLGHPQDLWNVANHV